MSAGGSDIRDFLSLSLLLVVNECPTLLWSAFSIEAAFRSYASCRAIRFEFTCQRMRLTPIAGLCVGGEDHRKEETYSNETMKSECWFLAIEILGYVSR